MSKKELKETKEVKELVNEKEVVDIEKAENAEKKNILKAQNVGELLSITGLDSPEVKDALTKIKRNTIYGVVDGYSYETLIKAKIYEYLRLGIARRVFNMMVEQAGRNPNAKATTEDLIIILSEMARLEIEYGLKPIIHAIPVANTLYIKADGFLYYAKNSGKLKSMKWNDKELENGSWQSECIVELTNGETYDGIAVVQPNPRVPSDDPREKARTKAMRRALRRAFAIGASDEPLNIDEIIQEVKEETNNLEEEVE